KASSARDIVIAGDATHNLNDVTGLMVQGNATGNTTLEVNDAGNTFIPFYGPVLTQYLVSPGQLTRTATALFLGLSHTYVSGIQYSGLTSLTIDGGPVGSYQYQVNSTSGTGLVSIKAASASDAVTVGEAGASLDGVSNLTVAGNGHTTVRLDDAATSNGVGAFGDGRGVYDI